VRTFQITVQFRMAANSSSSWTLRVTPFSLIWLESSSIIL